MYAPYNESNMAKFAVKNDLDFNRGGTMESQKVSSRWSWPFVPSFFSCRVCRGCERISLAGEEHVALMTFIYELHV